MSFRATALVALALILAIAGCRPTGRWGEEAEAKFLDWCTDSTYVGDMGGRGECECVLDTLEADFASDEAWVEVQSGVERDGFITPFDNASEKCLPPV